MGLGLTPLTPLVLRPLDLAWNYITAFPGFSACRWQMGFLSLHNHMSQFLIINNLCHIGYMYLLLVLFLWRPLNTIEVNISMSEPDHVCTHHHRIATSSRILSPRKSQVFSIPYQHTLTIWKSPVRP